MEIPGAASALDDPQMREKAEQESERLLEELKKAVKADIKDVGTLRKEMRISVPANVIADHLAHNYEELMHDATVPGFRKGRAPRRLIEKRFGSDVRESLKTSIVGQSFFAAVENAELEPLGDPRFAITIGDETKLMEIDEALQHIALQDGEDFAYTCEVEIKPTFELPELTGIPVKMPQVEITDERVDEHILRQRRIRGRYEPKLEGAAEGEDQIIADATLTVDGQVVKEEENLQLGIRPTRLDGVTLMTLGEVFKGVKPGDTPVVDCEVPDDYERSDLRGKQGQFAFKVHELKQLTPISQGDYVSQMGFESLAELRDDIRAEMETERDEMIERARKEQVLDYLLNNTTLDVPEGLSARQTDRAVIRRVLELQQMGMPMSDIETRIDELRTSAKTDVARDLKLSFILDKVAEQLELDVTDEEVNTEIARMARLYNRRFDRVRDDLQSQGMLAQLADKIRHDKCITKLLADAKLEEVTEPEKPAKNKEAGGATAGESGGKDEKDAPKDDA